MRRIDEVLAEIDHFVDRAILEDFIARGWVCPLRDQTDYIFEEVDISRIRLVCELHIDMKFEIETVDIILSLMDQLYKNKARLDKLVKALEEQPEDVRNAVLKSFKENTSTN
ncbi:MAG: chaperone modulatory protein CbpM [Nitrospinales bacterium]|jgi:chaperone modulatory protein CbpM